MLNDKAKKMLLDLARQAVKEFLERGRENEEMRNELFPDELQEKKGIFVAIYHRNELRGCIGSLLEVLPLWQACRENARSAAMKDVRFPPVIREELPDLVFEITIIGPVHALKDPIQVRPGVEGLILKKGFRREVFLPGSVSNLIKESKNPLNELKEKAGIEPDDAAPETWEIFEAEVINPQYTIRNSKSI